MLFKSKNLRKKKKQQRIRIIHYNYNHSQTSLLFPCIVHDVHDSIYHK